MKKTVTYSQLEALANDISHQMEASPAFSLFNSEKINRFFDKNKPRLQAGWICMPYGNGLLDH